MTEISFSNFGVFKISRESVEFSHQNGFNNSSDEILATCIPFGDPQEESIKITFFNNNYYFSYIKFMHEVDSGYGIIIDLNSIQQKIEYKRLELILAIKKLFELPSIINELTNKNILTVTLIPIIVDPSKLNFNYPNLDGLLFAFLAQIPFFLIGSADEIMTLFLNITSVFPQWVIQKITYVSQSASLSENVAIIGLPNTAAIKDNINRKKSAYHTILFLSENKVFAPFTSNLCQKMATAVQKKQFQQFVAIIESIRDIIIDNPNLSTKEEINKKFGYSLDDCQLILAMKNNLENNKAIDPKSLL